MARNGENLPLADAFWRPLPGDGHQLFKLHTWWRQNEMLQRFVTVQACAIGVKGSRRDPVRSERSVGAPKPRLLNDGASEDPR